LIPKNIGATSTIMAKFMKALGIRPAPLLATALLYGIRTDTAAFERSGTQDDLKAYHWLFKYANAGLLRRICRSEYLRAWLPLFSRAFRSLKDCRGNGAHASLNDVRNADLLVCIADFFTKVHGLRWIAVSGIVEKIVVVIFRGDGVRDMGQMAQSCFAEFGQGGGHRTLARAEFPLTAVPNDVKPADFVYQRLQQKKSKTALPR
ncbi:MAG: phosphoesterase, partial [Desulfovibrio sp.]|nr:phosphoesterase [Desulfovibrio sp.]